jgi:hypothetical protein
LNVAWQRLFSERTPIVQHSRPDTAAAHRATFKT